MALTHQVQALPPPIGVFLGANMLLKRAPYLEQLTNWPISGRHIMAQSDGKTMVVYQSYRPEIGNYAVKHQRFGGDFSFERMTWIKPNFLWMMYRNGWGSKVGQECVLAIHLRQQAFEDYLRQAVYSSYHDGLGMGRAEWQAQVKQSEVRLQWDPDHDPYGEKLPRRAIQLGLRGSVMKRFADEDIVLIEDISTYVHEQAEHVRNQQLQHLVLPQESPLHIEDAALRAYLQLDT